MTQEQQPDWELNPDNYQKDENGDFILKLDGTPKKKMGRRPGTKSRGYNFHSRTKVKQRKKKEIREKEKEVQKLASRLSAHRANLAKKKDTLDLLEGKPGVVEDKDLESRGPAVKKALEEKVVFKPNEGPQTEFLAAGETDVLYGGAAGGGKSYAMLVDPLRYAHKAAHRALILRRSMPELRELIDKSRELYPRAFPGCKYREVEKLWTFPSGAKIEFGFLERDADVYRYQGQAYSWIGFDEITHQATEFGWNYLASRLRTTDPEPRWCWGPLGQKEIH